MKPATIRASVAIGALVGIASYVLFAAAIWVGTRDLAGRLGGEGMLLLVYGACAWGLVVLVTERDSGD